MKKFPYIQVVLSGILSLALLVGGIASAVVISSQYSVRYEGGEPVPGASSGTTSSARLPPLQTMSRRCAAAAKR